MLDAFKIGDEIVIDINDRGFLYLYDDLIIGDELGINGCNATWKDASDFVFNSVFKHLDLENIAQILNVNINELDSIILNQEQIDISIDYLQENETDNITYCGASAIIDDIVIDGDCTMLHITEHFSIGYRTSIVDINA